MLTPRIKSSDAYGLLDRLLARRSVRYGGAVLGVALAHGFSLLFLRDFGAEFYLLVMFAVVLLVSVLAGFGPGLLATSLAAVFGTQLPPSQVGISEWRRFVLEGTLVSLGGMLHSARLRARDRLETKLRLERQILEIGDDERRRIGRELHDGLGQHLTGISLMSETLSQQLMAGETPDSRSVEVITRLVSEAVGITRDLARSLFPVTLELDGLGAGIQELAETSASLFGINCTCDNLRLELQLDRTRSLHLFRIVQEALNNSVRHGKAKNVRIGLARDANRLTVTVVDDGIGLSQKTSDRPGLGLRIMQYRARILNASLAVERAAPDGGTVVTCICPVDDQPLEG